MLQGERARCVRVGDALGLMGELSLVMRELRVLRVMRRSCSSCTIQAALRAAPISRAWSRVGAIRVLSEYSQRLEQRRCILHVLLSFRERLRAVSYTHLRAHETVLDLVCRLLLEKKKK
eukprot:TRINITY_DN25310_c0_g1_i1.p1 TRINITY_DN25310_c0_g1~~TRINITY_DN25310_c0_g1_i1.p1  ORF type:complete len:119 (+),score=33.51 TRINITY_DN25310_c0_g1_i1:215-571(+)